MGFPFKSFSPITRGVIDGANPRAELAGSAKYVRNAVYRGAYKLIARPGTQVALTLKDDQGSPANVTSVVALCHFGDGCLAVAHSTVTSKFYLYWLTDGLDNWYNLSKVLQNTLTPAPVGVLWSGIATPEKVLIAEGLGVAYIAHNDASTVFKTRKFDTTAGPPATLTDFQADLRGSGLEDTYFRGVVSFQQHLWGWGYGSQAGGDNDRPELLRFGQPFFAAMKQGDSFAVGHRVRSQRERVIGGIVAGEVLYFGLRYALWPVTGFGRNSWDKARPLDNSYGFAGPLAATEAGNGWLYYWSNRGPLRVQGIARPEPLYERLPTALAGVVDPKNVVAQWDPDFDQVVFLYQDQTSGRVSRLCAFDVLKDAFFGPDGDIGLGVRCAALVQPAALTGPAGPPVIVSTSAVAGTIATANFTPGDRSAQAVHQVEYRQVGTTPWVVASSSIPNVPTGDIAFQITGLVPGLTYEWRVVTTRNGQVSAYDGPEAASTFTTAINLLAPPSNLAAVSYLSDPVKGFYSFAITWHNSGEEGVSTEVHIKKQIGAPASGTLPLWAQFDPGVASANYTIGTQSGIWWFEIRHVKAGFVASSYVGGPLGESAPA